MKFHLDSVAQWAVFVNFDFIKQEEKKKHPSLIGNIENSFTQVSTNKKNGNKYFLISQE